VLLSAIHEDASRYRGTRFVSGVRRVRVDGEDGYRYVRRPPMDTTMSGGGVKVSDGHDHGVRPVCVHHPFWSRVLQSVVEEPRHHGPGDARDLAFGREERLGDGPEDLHAIAGFPVVEFVPDVFVDAESEFFELGERSEGGVFEGGEGGSSGRR